MADEFICADLNDKKVIENFVKRIDLCTYAFENLSYEILKSIAQFKEVHPSPNTLKIAQNRILEKKFANEHGIKTTEWRNIKSLAELKEGVKLYGNCILKSVSGGYDGKQQYRFKSLEDIDEKLDFSKEYVLEKFLNFKQEISIAVTRFKDGKISIYEPSENKHEKGILKESRIPANIDKNILKKSQDIAVKFAEKLNYVGTLNIEFMIDEKGNFIFWNGATEPHNGMWHTVNSYQIDQFMNHVRAILGLKFIENKKISNAVMTNILGDEIKEFRNKKFKENEFFFDYLKTEIRPGRKMGHLTQLLKD